MLVVNFEKSLFVPIAHFIYCFDVAGGSRPCHNGHLRPHRRMAWTRGPPREAEGTSATAVDETPVSDETPAADDTFDIWDNLYSGRLEDR